MVEFLMNTRGTRSFPVNRINYRFDNGANKVRIIPETHANGLLKRYGDKVFRIVEK